MEVAARRDFINAARREVHTEESVDDVLVGRPFLAEIRQLFGPNSIHGDYATSEPSQPIDGA
jgi:hypothetical protein